MINSQKVKASALNVHLCYEDKLVNRRLRHLPVRASSIVNDCLLQPMLHVSHPLLQFECIMHPLLSIAALFSEFYSHRI